MKKTLLIMAFSALYGVNYAYAQVPTVAANDEFLTLWDFTNDSSYSVDLGIASDNFASTLNAGYTQSITTGSDANLSAFLGQITTGDDVEWSVEGGYLTTVGGKTYGHLVNTFLPSDVTPTTFTGTSQSVFAENSTGITAITNDANRLATYYRDFVLNSTWDGTSVFYGAGAGGNAPQSLGQYEGDTYYILSNTGPVSGNLEAYTVDRTGSLAVGIGDQGALYLTLASNGLVLSNASISSVPLPASAWMFLSGLIGLLSVKKRRIND